MREFYETLSEKDLRRYAAVEAVQYVAAILGCDEKTIRQGARDLELLPHDEAAGRVRKKRGAKLS